MSAFRRLLADPGAYLSSIAGSTAAPAFEALVAEARAKVSEDARRYRGLSKANVARSSPIRAAILLAADATLTPRAREFTHRRFWAQKIRWVLRANRQHYGLQRAPCLRVIRAVLKQWTPPHGDALRLGSNSSIDTTKGNR